MRLGADIGGSKIEVAVLDGGGSLVLRRRVATPHESYDSALRALVELVRDGLGAAASECTIGIGLPGAISPRTGLVKNAYNTPFNGRALPRDLEAALGRPARFGNDANCFALSEAADGAARGARVVFGAILGTGAGGGIVVGGRVLAGRHGFAGEWGHNPLPWMRADEYPGPRCTCGRTGCLEQFVSGPALARDKAALGEETALARYEDRLARALAHVVNLLDPDVIVLGGGASNTERLYANLPPLVSRYVYAEEFLAPIVRAAHGDASGVRGAAMLWDQE
jgi:fructokinase